jgi:pyruvate,water dikinase
MAVINVSPVRPMPDGEKVYGRNRLPPGIRMGIKNLFTYWTNQAFSPGTVLREKYAAFKSLLEYDKQAHERMAELEEIYHGQFRVDFSMIERKYAVLSRCVDGIVSSLNRMHPSRYLELSAFYHKIDGYARHVFSRTDTSASRSYCLPLTGVSSSMLSLVGQKALNLAMIDQRFGLPTPVGFAITTHAFFHFTQHNRLKPAMDDLLSGVNVMDMKSLHRRSDELRHMILQAPVPQGVVSQIRETFDSVFGKEAATRRVAVRSSAVGEDSRASFAGQYETVLNVDKEQLLTAYKTVLASKYSPEALVYRINFGLTDMETPMAVLVVEMIDAVASGVMYTQVLEDPTAGLLEVHAVLGLGELLVQGGVTPDIFKVRKEINPRIAEKHTAAKEQFMATAQKGGTLIEKPEVRHQMQASIDDTSVLTLATWGMRLEADAKDPRDIEWCKDQLGRLYLLQSRPLKTVEQNSPAMACRFDEISNAALITGADRAASGVVSGTVFVAQNESEVADLSGGLPDNAVLVTRTASAHYVKYVEKLSAFISESGSIAGHFASVAREFGIPTLVNAQGATQRLKTGQSVTVYSDEGIVYEGIVPSLLTHPCLRKRPIADSPFSRKLDYLMGFVSPLKLIDPKAPAFTPGGCRSLHDVIRFAHESGTREMFSIGDRAFGKSRGAKKLRTQIPMLIYLMDVGGGLADDSAKNRAVAPEQIHCVPFHAVWKGLSHPGIEWGAFSHFNWAEYDKIVMSGGIISAESAQLASYAVLSRDYLNLNLKFGYHFVILDTLCGAKAQENHILFRFNGGGGDAHGRSLRAAFLTAVLQRLEFGVARTSDLVDARFADAGQKDIMGKLDMLGRLLGATRLMDMYLSEGAQVGAYVDAFFNGRYRFSTVELDPSP